MLKKSGFYERQSVPAGEVFVREGEDAYQAYLVQSGKVRVFTEVDGKKVTLAEVEAGHILGESALIMNEPRSASCEALEPTTLIIITRPDFEKMLAKTDSTIQSVLKHLIKRLKGQNTKTIDAVIEQDSLDPDAALALMTKNFTRTMSKERKQEFIEAVRPHVTGIIKAMSAFKDDRSGV